MFVGYEEAKGMQMERIERSLQRYRVLAALATDHRVQPAAEADVVQLPHAGECECTEQIGA